VIHLQLDDAFIDGALEFLSLRRRQPTFEYLNALIEAFIHKTPWESVTRILKRDAAQETADCPRFPREVWRDAMNFGGGGTCFEINYAFFALLNALGYEGCMTLNDMNEARKCHAAIVILVNGQNYLVDVSVPLPRAVVFFSDSTVYHYTPWLNFTIRPEGENRYTVERAPHARPYIFTLNDVPVNAQDFEAAIETDYLPTGYFLNRIVINKMMDGKAWLFNSDTKPFMLESFDHDGKREIPLNPETLAESLAERYRIPAEKIFAALSLIEAIKEPA
jgi:arylamine N-acetyltransferase